MQSHKPYPDNKNSAHLLLGVTGSIATGKSTVANMLAELGAPIIDFDMLAREVVEPDKPAWADIVEFFGDKVLEENRALNRKALSDIVFNDADKRKKLESFTHPRIQELYLQKLDCLTRQDPNAIVQVVVPLLIEVNMQKLFHKLLVVYTPPETQMQRLVQRDGIAQAQAQKILQSQISIDEKVRVADYVIHNDKSIKDTRKQVNDLWSTLKKEQEKISKEVAGIKE